MKKMPVNEGLEKVATPPMDLQLFAEGEIDTGDTGGTSDADVSTDNIQVGDESNTADAIVDNDSETVNQSKEDGTPESVKQSPEADRAFAEMRRKAEAAEKKAESARQEIQTQRDAKFAERFGQSHGIQTEAQYWAAIDREEKARVEQQKKQLEQKPQQIYDEYVAKGYDPEFARLKADEVKREQELNELKQRLEAGEQRETEKQNQFARQMAMQQMQKEHVELSKKYGDLVPATIPELDEATQDMMRRGVPLKAAWLATHEDEILEFAKKTGTSKALRNIDSKAHLRSEKSGSGDFGIEVILSAEEWETWKGTFPNDTDAQLKKRAAKYHKKAK